jgi:hypothetical protein
MNERTYPYNAWVLTPSFKPKEVELVKPYRAFGGQDYGDLTETGKMYGVTEMFPTKRAAVQEGWRRVDKQKADLDKKLIGIAKKRKALQEATRDLEPARAALPQGAP